MPEQKVTLELGGQTLTISTGKMAKLAGGSAVVQLGDTVVLVAASADKRAAPNRETTSGLPGHFTSSSSTSNTSVALGGMTPPAPRSP